MSKLAAILNKCARAVVAACLTSVASAQTPARTDTIFLDVLQKAAETTDRRSAQIELITKQSALRLQTIRNELLPSLSANANAQYLSDVASVSSVFGGALPGGLQVPSPYRDQYDASVTAREPLFDATRKRRTDLENAQAAESEARLRAAIWQQRQQVNDAFFAIQLNDAQQNSIDASVRDLTARRAAAQARVDAGAALPSETLIIDAELARRNQMRAELQVQREATRAVLSMLVGTPIPVNAVFITRGNATAAIGDTATTIRARPEYLTFGKARETIAARSAELSARDLPRVSAFSRVGYGRPGLNPLGRSFDAYWSAGLQFEWTPLNWGRTRRDVQLQELQADIVQSDEAAFTETVKRTAVAQLGQIGALEQSLAMDDSVLALRDRILREARLRFDEGEITSADYIARQTEHLSAQLDRETRRVRLSEARARYLTTIGREVR